MGRESVFVRLDSFTTASLNAVALCGISSRFRLLSPSQRLVTHALLTRPLLSIHHINRNINSEFLVQLACVKHAASVRPEP